MHETGVDPEVLEPRLRAVVGLKYGVRVDGPYAVIWRTEACGTPTSFLHELDKVGVASLRLMVLHCLEGVCRAASGQECSSHCLFLGLPLCCRVARMPRTL